MPGMQLPARIGRYELEEYLGGGMSHVYRARDMVLGRTVAVKILIDKGGEDPDVKERFLAEACTASNISHENILGIYDFGEDNDHHPYMVMEFLWGEDLRSAIKRQNTGDMRNRMRIALEIGRALEYIHTQKIVHRDLKPENVHISLNGQVKLMDFGISKTEGLDLTRTGYVVGTPYYMTPEQVMGQRVTAQVDVYSFGVLLYELITGMRAISGDSMERIFYAVLNEPIPVEPMRRAGAPAGLCQLVSACTAKSPTERPQGFAHICRDLKKLMAAPDRGVTDQETGTLVLPERKPTATTVALKRWRKPLSWMIAGILGLAAVGISIYLIQVLDGAPSKQPAVVEVPKKAPDESAPPRDQKSVPAVASKTPSASRQTRENSKDGLMYVYIEPGKFTMGCSQGDSECSDDEKPRHEVTITRGFWLGQTPVTQEAYERVIGTNRSVFKGARLPVEDVTWDEAQAYCKAVGMRLPTEAEWEYAARGGSTAARYGKKDQIAWSFSNSGQKTHEVGQKQPNAFGLYDMLGNVFEFVGDWYDEKYYEQSPTTDPPGPASGQDRVLRGGAWGDIPRSVRASYRDRHGPSVRVYGIGFRCAGELR